ncbi:hypothetical protein ACWIYZ_11290 [Ursidibacter arcticus]
MSRTRLTVSIDMIAPISNDEYPLLSNKGEVVFSMNTIFSNNSYIEVYEKNEVFEWRIVDIVKNEVGVNKRVVIYDTVQTMYLNYSIALLEALLFCRLNDL